MKKIAYITFTVLLLVFNFDGFAAINVVFRPDSRKEYPGLKGEPIIECAFRATQNGTPIVLNNDNAILLQSSAMQTQRDVAHNTTITFDAPDADGYQLARWTSAIATPHTATFELVVTNNNEVGTRTIPPLYGFGYEIAFWDIDGKHRIQKIDLKGKNFLQFRFSTRGSFPDPDTETGFVKAPWVDSITFTCPEKKFSYIWTPFSPDDYGSPNFAPVKMTLGNTYQITVRREGVHPEDEFIREYMIFHFGGGIKFRLEIVNGVNVLEPVLTLKLLSPIGGEKLAPCQEFEIKWEGQSNLHPVHIQYSTDNKDTWNGIAIVSGATSSYIWKVPNTVSDNCFVRVLQSFNRSSPKLMQYDTFAINSAIFNSEATRAITTSSNANIVEWDLYSNSNPTPMTVVNSGNNSRIPSAIYIENNKRIVALNMRDSTLIFINSGNNSIVKTVKLPAGFSGEKLLPDIEHRFICVQPSRYGNRLLFVNSEGEFVTYHSENIPITNVYFANKNEAYISLLDNTIKILSLENFPNITVKEELDFAKGYNLIETIAGSQDSRLIGLSFRVQIIDRSGDNYPWPADNVVYDRKNARLFQNFKILNDIAHSIDFNPAGTLAILGYSGEGIATQIFIVDLTDDKVMNNNPDNMERMKPFTSAMLGMTLAKTGNSLLAYSSGENNCQLINFSFPETAMNKTAFSIKEPVLSFSQEITLRDLIIGTGDSLIFPLLLCNTGEVVAILDNAFFNSGIHFKIESELPIILQPGECKDIFIVVHPLDTGKLSDTLKFVACGKYYNFPFTVRGLNRKLTLLNSPFDFGEVCLNENKIAKFDLFRNDDTVDVLINRIVVENSSCFELLNSVRDVVLKPGEIYTVELKFTPNVLGEINGRLIIRHSNQTNVTVASLVTGTGIGTFLEVSHAYLPFIPEIKERTITVKNTGDAFLQIDSADIQPEGFYRVNTPLPLSIAPLQTAEVKIEYLGNIIANARLKLLAKPCARTEDIVLMPYTGTATLTIPQVNANPKDTNVAIAINIQHSESYPYRGERFFYSEFEINPRIFYPKYAVSKFGKTEITKNEIVNDKRIFGVKITGDFNSYNAELVSISGVAALCEVDNSDINFVSSSIFFGDSVKILYTNGIFQLVGLCPDRLLLRDNLKLSLTSITPNPASNHATLNYNILEEIDSEITFEIFDLLGNKFYSDKLDYDSKGLHTKTFDVSNLTQGTYKIFIRYENATLSYNLNVIR